MKTVPLAFSLNGHVWPVLAYSDEHGKVMVPIKAATPQADYEVRLYAEQQQDQQSNPEFYARLAKQLAMSLV